MPKGEAGGDGREALRNVGDCLGSAPKSEEPRGAERIRDGRGAALEQGVELLHLVSIIGLTCIARVVRKCLEPGDRFLNVLPRGASTDDVQVSAEVCKGDAIFCHVREFLLKRVNEFDMLLP